MAGLKCVGTAVLLFALRFPALSRADAAPPPDDCFCLTGNAPRAELNLSTGGAYTYRDERFEREYFPSYPVETGPGLTHGMGPGTPDAGGTGGWVPFNRGSLTDGAGADPESVLFPAWHRRKLNYDPVAPSAHVVVFDLKRDHFLCRIEIEAPTPAWEDVVLWVRPEGQPDYVLLERWRGPGAAVKHEKTASIAFLGVNAAARFVRLRFEFLGFHHYYSGARFGLDEVRIWGRALPDATAASEPRAFRWQGGVVAASIPEVPQYVPPQDPVVFPQPRDMQVTGSAFLFTDQTRIMFAAAEPGRRLAQWLARELRQMTGVRLPVSSGPAALGDIVIGDISTAPELAVRAAAKGLTMARDRPAEQGYALVIDPDGAWLIGVDPPGTFNGLQTLLQLVRWSADGTRVLLDGVRILDWPAIRDRAVGHGFLGPHMLAGHETTVRMYTRLKLANVGWHETGRGPRNGRMRPDGSFDMPSYGLVPAPEVEATNRMYADYFFDVRPVIDIMTGEEGDVEVPPGVDWKTLRFDQHALPCPSGPLLHRFLARLDEHLRIHPQTGHVYIAFRFRVGEGAYWNVCPLCRARNLGDAELFVDFITRIRDHCRNRGKTPIFHNVCAFHYQLLLDNERFRWGRGALEGLPKDIGLVASYPDVMQRLDALGFGYIAVHHGAARVSGLRCDGTSPYAWVDETGPWIVLVTGSNMSPANIAERERFWRDDNPSAPGNIFGDRIGRAAERLNEIYTGRLYPSLMRGIERRYSCVDMRDVANWSHIDDVAGDGDGWLDQGPNHDLRRLPSGRVRFCGNVPFDILDPRKNGGRSVVAVANERRSLRQGDLPAVVRIPVARHCASLLFLEATYRRAPFLSPTVRLYMAQAMFTPSYRIVYDDGCYEMFRSEPYAPREWDWPYSRHLRSRASEPMDAAAAAQFHARKEHLLNAFQGAGAEGRPAWLGHTDAGDEAALFCQEWVNAYPEKAVAYVECRFPVPELKADFTHVVFAVTAAEPTFADRRIWGGRDRRSLPAVEALAVPRAAEGRPIFAGGRFVPVGTDKKTFDYVNAGGTKRAIVRLGSMDTESDRYRRYPLDVLFDPGGYVHLGEFSFRRRQTFQPLEITFPEPVRLCRVAWRGRFRWLPWMRGSQLGSPYLKVDVTLEGSPDGKTWRRLAEDAALIGEEGTRHHALPAVPLTAVRVSVDGRPYLGEGYDYANLMPGLTYLGLFEATD